jgi:aspartate 1-decarboxylase
MQIEMFRAKLHQATVTQSDLNYEGSITVDQNLLDACGILVHEKVDVLNINNGERFTTYTIPGEADSGIIGINGAAARLVQEGDKLIILSYAKMNIEEAKTFKPKVIVLDDENKIKNP